jgi:hypothetical protein
MSTRERIVVCFEFNIIPRFRASDFADQPNEGFVTETLAVWIGRPVRSVKSSFLTVCNKLDRPAAERNNPLALLRNTPGTRPGAKWSRSILAQRQLD